MRMSPVAELRIKNQQIAEYQEALARAARQIYKLKQEVTGGMQVIYCLASQCPDRTLTLKAADLITSAGSLQRRRNDDDTYSFIAILPTPEELADLQKHVEATNDAHTFDVPPVPIGQDEPTAAELGQAALGE